MPHWRPYDPVADRQAAIGLSIRDIDRLEVAAATGHDAAEGIAHSIALSELLWVIDNNGTVEGIFGVTSEGCIWLLMTDNVRSFWRAFAQGSKEVIEVAAHHYPILWNFCAKENKLTIRWLQWLGFTISDQDVTFHDPAVPFRLFYRR